MDGEGDGGTEGEVAGVTVWGDASGYPRGASVAAGCWAAISRSPAMSRSTNGCISILPLVEFLVLVLLRPILDRLFTDLKLAGVMGARIVDRPDRGTRVPVEENSSAGYTGSTGTGELVTLAGVSADLGGTVGGRYRELGGLLSRFGKVSVRRLTSLRRSRRMKRTPRVRMMRIVIGAATEIAMIAFLNENENQPRKTAITNTAHLEDPLS
jgi:hypothetical protein